jgi:hypothetical protein
LQDNETSHFALEGMAHIELRAAAIAM